MKEMFGKMLSALFFGTLYFILGVVIAVPYTILASGNFEHFGKTLILGPIGVLFLVVAWISGAAASRSLSGGIGFWACVLYCISPILLNGASIIAKAIGYEEVGNVLFYSRYYSLLAIPIIVITLAAMYEVALRQGIDRLLQWADRKKPLCV